MGIHLLHFYGILWDMISLALIKFTQIRTVNHRVVETSDDPCDSILAVFGIEKKKIPKKLLALRVFCFFSRWV